MRIFKEEVFGPVLSIATANNLDEALRFANGVEYGLTTSIFTENIDTIMNFVEEVETGMVHVNEPTIGGEAQLPFGGTKSTGVGEREMAEEGLNFFTELKTVFINYSGKAERSMIEIACLAARSSRFNVKVSRSLERLNLERLNDLFIDRRRALPVADIDNDAFWASETCLRNKPCRD